MAYLIMKVFFGIVIAAFIFSLTFQKLEKLVDRLSKAKDEREDDNE